MRNFQQNHVTFKQPSNPSRQALILKQSQTPLIPVVIGIVTAVVDTKEELSVNYRRLKDGELGSQYVLKDFKYTSPTPLHTPLLDPHP
jgi:hypothetical protein